MHPSPRNAGLVACFLPLTLLAARVPAQGGPDLLGTFTCRTEVGDAVELNGRVVFTIDRHAWASDGTVAGTKQLTVHSLTGGSHEHLVRMGDHVYYSSYQTTTGDELWRTDGTVAGTQRVHDYLPGRTSTEPRDLAVLGNRLFFRGQTPPSGGLELFVSDGTQRGTGQFLDIFPGANGSNPAGFVRLGDRLVFTANDGTHGNELWATDGTKAGTGRISDIEPGAGSARLARLGVAAGLAWFSHTRRGGHDLIVTDGTAAGTRLLRSFPDTPYYHRPVGSVVEVAGAAWFTSELYSASMRSTYTLWTSDGTTAGTRAIGQIFDPISPNGVRPELRAFGSRLLHTRFTAAAGIEPWLLDPATGKAWIVGDLAPGPAGSVLGGSVLLPGDRGVLDAQAGTTREVWAFDTTGAQAPVRLSADGDAVFAVGARFAWFTRHEAGRGHELSRTDGTAAGTARVVGEAIPGANGLWRTHAVGAGGRLFVLGFERVSTSGRFTCPMLWRVDPGAFSHPVGRAGAGGLGAAVLLAADPVIGGTTALDVVGMPGGRPFATVLDAPANRPLRLGDLWLHGSWRAPVVVATGTTTGQGVGTGSLAIPADASLTGLGVVVQGFTVATDGLRASRAAFLSVGR